MDWTGCDVVEVVPGKVSGVPILKRSRVQADAVLESYALGESAEEIAYSYSLNPGDIRKVLSFAAFSLGIQYCSTRIRTCRREQYSRILSS